MVGQLIVKEPGALVGDQSRTADIARTAEPIRLGWMSVTVFRLMRTALRPLSPCPPAGNVIHATWRAESSRCPRRFRAVESLSPARGTSWPRTSLAARLA